MTERRIGLVKVSWRKLRGQLFVPAGETWVITKIGVEDLERTLNFRKSTLSISIKNPAALEECFQGGHAPLAIRGGSAAVGEITLPWLHWPWRKYVVNIVLTYFVESA